MAEQFFRFSLVTVSLGFVAYFGVVVVPPLLESGDVIGAFAAGFANPYSSGYSADVVACWLVLVAWVVYEARTLSIRRGWICLVLGIVPGVVVGLAAYLLLRAGQLSETRSSGAV
jgi:hypothetical protein